MLAVAIWFEGAERRMREFDNVADAERFVEPLGGEVRSRSGDPPPQTLQHLHRLVDTDISSIDRVYRELHQIEPLSLAATQDGLAVLSGNTEIARVGVGDAGSGADRWLIGADVWDRVAIAVRRFLKLGPLPKIVPVDLL